MTKERANELVNKINLTGIINEIAIRTNQTVNLQFEIKEKEDNFSIYITDPTNYANQMGMMSCLYETVFIQSFGVGHFNPENNTIRFTIDFSFEYKTGGRNGTTILSFNYNLTNNQWFITK